MPRILIAIALAAGLAAVAVGHASGESAPGPLWATVNTCTPTSVGVRASLPGNGTQQTMRVRFTAEYWAAEQERWVPVKGVASSPWLDAGSADYIYQQAGWTFQFDPVPPGQRFQVRGLAEMQWLDHGTVVRAVSRVTQAGAVGVAGGGSLASCSLG